MILLAAAITIYAGANNMWWLSGPMLVVTVLLGWREVRIERRACERAAHARLMRELRLRDRS